MNQWSRKTCIMGTVGILAGIGLPLAAWAQGMTLRPGANYALGFEEGAVPATALPPVAANGNQKVITIYRVLAASGDQQWYRIRMVARNPQGGWYTPPGTADVWVNINYVMWVQEVTR